MALGEFLVGFLGTLGAARLLRERGGGSQIAAADAPAKATTNLHHVHSLTERVRYIQKKIRQARTDPGVRRFAVEAVSKRCGNRWCITEGDHWGEVRALFDAVCDKIRYVGDIVGVDTFTAAKHTLEWGGDDCDGYSIVLGASLNSIGYPVKLRVVAVGERDWNHIYLLVGIPPTKPARWVPLDASVNKPAGWEVPKQQVVRVRDYQVP
jgi:hypothetical protein